ncbi:MAG: hypothetical protein JXR76_04635 [Deltaproteobacteria bacterium]|nr:hypothetical protein [Deltaproteobacteria bacterium]
MIRVSHFYLPAMLIVLLISPKVRCSIDCPESVNDNEDAKELASDWFTRGSRLVSDGDFLDASQAFLCSYQLFPHPASMLNAALAAQTANEKNKACTLYAKYLPLADDTEKTRKVQEEMAKLQCNAVQAKEQQGSAVTHAAKPEKGIPTEEGFEGNDDAPDEKPPVETPPMPPSPDSSFTASALDNSKRAPLPKLAFSTFDVSRRSAARIAGTTLIIIGTTGLLTGTFFQVMAYRAQKKGEQNPISYPDHKKYTSDTTRYQNAAYIGFISGGALIVTGLLLRLFGPRRHDENSKVLHRQNAVLIAPFATGLQLSTRF